MLVPLLLALSSAPTQSPPPKIEAPPQVTRTSAVEDLSKLTVKELLAQQPARPWWDGGLVPVAAEMLRRTQSGRMTDEEWRTVLTTCEVVRTQPRWPASHPFQIGIQIPEWLLHTMVEVRVVEPDLGVVKFDNRDPSFCGNCQEGRVARAQHLDLGMFPSGTSRVLFEITVTQREGAEEIWPKSRASKQVRKGGLERPIQAVESPADVLPESKLDSDTRVVHDSLHAWLSDAPATKGDLFVSFTAPFARHPAAKSLGVSLNVEVWNGSRFVDRQSLVAYGRASKFDDVDELQGDVTFQDLPQGLNAPGADLSAWTLRVSGLSSGVPGAWDANRWWNGSFSIPLTEALKKSE